MQRRGAIPGAAFVVAIALRGNTICVSCAVIARLSFRRVVISPGGVRSVDLDAGAARMRRHDERRSPRLGIRNFGSRQFSSLLV
jgi:hypothetical protein